MEIGRRKFLNLSLAGGISLLYLPVNANPLLSIRKKPKYHLSLDTPTRLFDEKRRSWVHPRAGIVPGAGKNGLPRVVMTMNIITGSDVFNEVYGLHTDDLGLTWTDPELFETMSPRYEMINGARLPVAVSDFWPQWHSKSKLLLGTGHTVVYSADFEFTAGIRPRQTTYSFYNPLADSWDPWQKMEMPDPEKFFSAGAGSTQRYDLEDGTILLPVYFTPPGGESGVTIVKCKPENKTLKYIEHGNELFLPEETRGLSEPSITCFEGEYFMTIRSDRTGFVSRSSDGLSFSPIQEWKFDDGTELGSYNTQQHWVTHSEGLFLVYTRRGANNDHIVRHRAPLFMGQVDPRRLCVIRKTEQILIPQRGATLGNFGVTDVSPDETWVTDAEIMLHKDVEKYGSDGSVFAARIHWNKPNRLFSY